MNSQYAVQVENLGKKYKIGAILREDDTLIQSFANLTVAPFRRIYRMLRGEIESAYELDQDFWAIRDVSFKVKHGEVIGIIGRNGAGKSTLLKLLSSITEPSEGRIVLNGRVGSLLEVGTGFHSELTGRENVYLNGTILGMTRKEVKRKFDDIVQFAGVEQFIDTPVKHYSSGMTVRLGFAVAAHLEPEILIVDEVLSVGDAEFQKKSIGKMSEVASAGRTVLFVSHNLASVENLCNRGIVLDSGHVAFAGTQTEAITHYTKTTGYTGVDLLDRPDREGSGEIWVTAIQLRNANGDVVDVARSNEDLFIYLFYKADKAINIERLSAGIAAKTMLNVPVFHHHNTLTNDVFRSTDRQGAFVLHIQNLPLIPTSYKLTYSLHMDGKYIDRIEDAFQLDVTASDVFASGRIPQPGHGHTLVLGNWEQIPGITSGQLESSESILE